MKEYHPISRHVHVCVLKHFSKELFSRAKLCVFLCSCCTRLFILHCKSFTLFFTLILSNLFNVYSSCVVSFDFEIFPFNTIDTVTTCTAGVLVITVTTHIIPIVAGTITCAAMTWTTMRKRIHFKVGKSFSFFLTRNPHSFRDKFWA